MGRLARRVAVAIALCATGMAASQAARAATVTIDEGTRYQTIDGWGASLVFWNELAGPASLYHEPGFINAYAREMGCNILRIQCSPHALTGPSGRLDDPVELGPDLDANIAKFDFENSRVKIFGQVAQYLKKNALEPDRVKFMADFWTPPHWMKEPTGATASFAGRPARPTPFVTFQGSDTVGGHLKQTPENLEQFARYIAAWTRGFERHYGITFDNISIQNELSFENPFDSCTYLNRQGPDGKPEGGQYWQYAAALKDVKDEFKLLGITTKIRGPHMGNIGESPANPWALNDQCNFVKAVKDNPDPELFGFLSIYTSNYIDPRWGAAMLHAFREGKQSMPQYDWASWLYCPGFGYDKPYWIAEMGGGRPQWLAGPDGTPGDGAMRVAQNIHNAVVWGNVSAYVYWQALNGGRPTPGGSDLLGNTFDVSQKPSAAYRHFSRYVRPGAVRVKTTPTAIGTDDEMDTSNSLDVSAFVHDADRTVTVVLINLRGEPQPLTIRVPARPNVRTYQVYRTDADESFAAQPALEVAEGHVVLDVPAYSIVTLYGKEGGRTAR